MNEAAAHVIDALPGSVSRQSDLLRRLMVAIEKDPRIRVAMLAGSLGRSEGDEHSDVNVLLVAHDAVWPAIVEDLHAMAAGLGEVIDSYGFFMPSMTDTNPMRSVTLYSDGSKLELACVPLRLLSGRAPWMAVLWDPDSHAEQTIEPAGRRISEEELDQWTFFAWETLMLLAKNLSRERLWSALDALNSARAHCIRIWAAQRDLEFPATGGHALIELDGSPDAGFEGTLAGLDPSDLRRAGLACAVRLEELAGERPIGTWTKELLERLPDPA